ncbi:ADCK3 [Cordylochernes scorpioides]|uniref:ADCK3 n=1 Tax=Cordylochernes scorpioides TaxID=51811 RepID=A0ABY6KNM5_9ARAC|nr:ADCK3 [Cordylochernes scorpioides]
MAVGVGVGAIAESARRTLGTSDFSAGSSLLLSEANANRIVNTLCHVRGAALKLGQMISIQVARKQPCVTDNNLISPQLQAVFERVRQSADFMPAWQMERVMVSEFGPEWKSNFAQFETKPFAAASIGQVHRGELPDGRVVAVKIQYPGVAEGIESDISNLATVLKTWNILPRGFYMENLMASARRELAWEVDYIREAECCQRFRELVAPYPGLIVPAVIPHLSSKKVLTTEFVQGIPVDRMVDAPQDLRNLVCRRLLELCLRELFQFQFMQTDPNWSNFLFNPTTGDLSLLDFGACRSYSDHFVDGYLRVIKAAAVRDRPAVLKYLLELGFLTGYESKTMEEAHSEAVLILGEAFSHQGLYDFGQQDVTRRITTIVPVMLQHRLTPPPEESYSLHRKLSGLFLLSSRLKACINCSQLFDLVSHQRSQAHQ